MGQAFNYIVPVATFILGLLGYERLLKKDSSQYTKDMTTLITKVDMLLNQSITITQDVKEHSAMLIKHDVKITDIENTLDKLGGGEGAK
jgi:hypothetical protein